MASKVGEKVRGIFYLLRDAFRGDKAVEGYDIGKDKDGPAVMDAPHGGITIENPSYATKEPAENIARFLKDNMTVTLKAGLYLDDLFEFPEHVDHAVEKDVRKAVDALSEEIIKAIPKYLHFEAKNDDLVSLLDEAIKRRNMGADKNPHTPSITASTFSTMLLNLFEGRPQNYLNFVVDIKNLKTDPAITNVTNTCSGAIKQYLDSMLHDIKLKEDVAQNPLQYLSIKLPDDTKFYSELEDRLENEGYSRIGVKNSSWKTRRYVAYAFVLSALLGVLIGRDCYNKPAEVKTVPRIVREECEKKKCTITDLIQNMQNCKCPGGEFLYDLQKDRYECSCPEGPLLPPEYQRPVSPPPKYPPVRIMRDEPAPRLFEEPPRPRLYSPDKGGATAPKKGSEMDNQPLGW